MLKIKIGHPAYSHENALAYAHSKNQAVEILRERGAKRDHARAAIDLAMLRDGFASVEANYCPVEIAIVEGHLTHEEKVAKERDIINRNQNLALALDLTAQHKGVFKCAPHRSDLVRKILLVKQGIYLAPPPRKVEVKS